MEEKNKNIVKDILSYVLIILVVVTIRVFIFDPVRVDGPSMNNTLVDGEVVILNKLQYRKTDIKRYDIVVVKVEGKKIIKRVIGLPGETIEIKNNKVYANGVELDNSFTSSVTADFTKEEFEKTVGFKKLQAEQYFILGDNRDVSLDSRYSEVGAVTKDQIVGKAAIIVWPINKIRIIK